MKNRESVFRMSLFFFVMTICLVLLSWIGSLNGWEPVQSLLSEEGIRWELNHVISDYVQTPALGIVLVMLMGMGIAGQGGIGNALKQMLHTQRQWSGKEKRSLVLAISVGMVYILLVGLSIPLLKSVTGSLLHSPFQKGFFYILSFGIGLMGLVYGYATNRFRHAGQVIDAMSCLLASRAGYFVTLFFVVQFFSILEYTRISEWIGVKATFIDILFQVCCYLPFLLSFKRFQSKII